MKLLQILLRLVERFLPFTDVSLPLKKSVKLPEIPYDVEMRHEEFAKYKWQWENFTPKELASKGDGLLLINKESMDKLQAFRTLVGAPIIINSAYRSKKHNKSVGGARYSQHLLGKAFDIRIGRQVNRKKIHKLAKQVGFTGFGDYNSFVHIDTGRKRHWDNRNV